MALAHHIYLKSSRYDNDGNNIKKHCLHWVSTANEKYPHLSTILVVQVEQAVVCVCVCVCVCASVLEQ